MTLHDANDQDGPDEMDDSDNPRRTVRRARALKRNSSRSTLLKRKKQAVEDKPIESEKKEEAPSRRETRPKRVAVRKTVKKVTAKPARTKKKPVEKPPQVKISARRHKTVVIENEEYEIKSFPDGTQLKVKVSDRKSARRKPPIKRRSYTDDDGPGPAIVERPSAVLVTSEREIDLGSIKRENRRAISYLKKRLDIEPRVAVILGSGQASVADLASSEPIPFSKIPGFTAPSVPGHPGQVRGGMVEGVPTLFCEGRLHYYETGSMADVIKPLRTFLALGVEYVILSTSAGAVNRSYKLGDVMFVSDHINMMGDNPLFGADPQSHPSPFVDVSRIYNKQVNDTAERLCRRARVKSQNGVLAGMRGPVYETPAELSWLRSMGADAVCMSVIPEALAAAHVNVPVTALALIVNTASGHDSVGLSHESVERVGKDHSDGLKRIIRSLLSTI